MQVEAKEPVKQGETEDVSKITEEAVLREELSQRWKNFSGQGSREEKTNGRF